MGYYIWPFTLT